MALYIYTYVCISGIIYSYLVGGIYTYPSEKYEFVSWDNDIRNIWKKIKCSKPPTRHNMFKEMDIALQTISV